MDDCVETHVKCRAFFGDIPPFLPTRVLEIQRSGQVKLREMSKNKEIGRYACLSHCWGGILPLQLTSSMVQVFQDTGIPWETLPRTFQHAVDMTHRLGLKYIWIDSLCIVQDDIEDWRREGSQMSEIYSGACVTFAATNATDSNKGFYQETLGNPRLKMYTYTLKHQKDSKSLYDIHAIEMGALNSDFNGRDLPLFKRAWAFQEQILTPRMVHFANDMLYWECLESRACETREYMTHPIIKTSVLVPDAIDTIYSLSIGRSLANTSITPHALWRAMVAGYTHGSLTFGKDKLPALQGVAKRIQSQRRCAYYAGLWEDTLCLDLSWRSVRRTTRLSEYRAPSWSWASTEGRIHWFVCASAQCHASIVSVETIPVGHDPLGEVRGGTLVLKGLCLPAVVPVDLIRGHDTNHLEIIGTDGSIRTEWQADNESSSLEHQNLTVILIASDATYKVLVAWYFLVLVPLDTENQVFQRIGSIQHIDSIVRDPIYYWRMFDSTVLERYNNNESWEGCGQYREITIV
jgi:hypothetical protein